MKKLFKIFCIVGLSLFLAGGAIFGVGFIFAKGDLKALSHLKGEEYAYTETAENPIESIYIRYDSSASIAVTFSDTADSVSVEYVGLKTKKDKPASEITLSDTNGELRIVEKTKLVGKFSTFNFLKLKVKVTLPADRTYDLTLDGTTGDIDLKGNGKLNNLILSTDTGDIDTERAEINCLGKMNLETDTGDIELGMFTADSLEMETDTGDISLQDGTVKGKIDVNVDSGEIEIEGRLSAQEIVIETDTGDVETERGVLDAMIIRLEADTGDIEVMLTGNKSNYTIYVEKDTGKCNVSSQAGGEKQLFIETDTGDIHVTFAE